MSCTIEFLPEAGVAHGPIEVVERKGLGHPDTISDALAEAFSLALSRFYLERFGTILHHNVDKVLLWGGASRPAFGGGEIVAPIEIYLAGRAVTDLGGVAVPVAELAEASCQDWLARHLRHLDVRRDVRLHTLVRPGSADLEELFTRKATARAPLANDTSCGVGFAPLSPLEALVLGLEHTLNTAAVKSAQPALGEDIKVMGVRRGAEVELTVGCAMVDRHLRDVDDYLAAKEQVAGMARALAASHGFSSANVQVNAADAPERGSLFLTVSGTSAEAGDDGEAGRGNRVNGLITPLRPMTLESVAGKNPITHVGKLYNLIAGLIAEQAAAELGAGAEVDCCLVSRIGHPIDNPPLAHLRVRGTQRQDPVVTRRLKALVESQLASLPSLWRDLLSGALQCDRWPLLQVG